MGERRRHLSRIGMVVAGVAAVAVWSACTSVDLEGRIVTPDPTPLLDRGDGGEGSIVASNGAMVINVCHPLLATSGGGTTLAVEGGEGIVAGRRILLIQMQRPLSNPDVADASPFIAPDDVGRWEARTVGSIVVGTDGVASVALDRPVAPPYGSSIVGGERTGESTAQVCTLPQFEEVEVRAGGRLLAPAWNGFSGGVLAFVARGTVRVDGRLDASGRGFRGGNVPTGVVSQAANVVAETTSLRGEGAPADGAGKGEGVDGNSWYAEGRGNMTHGGGGGNGLNGGGGGGGNGGAGGLGGKQVSTSGDNPDTAGRGGSRLTIDVPRRLAFGGGGGGGQHNELAVVPGRGAAGGGIVIVVADRLVGQGVIEARGADAPDCGDGTNADGAGGGGAGGTIVLWSTGSRFDGAIDAAGGRGGDVVRSAGAQNGPGGGGGGGRIHAPGLSFASASVAGGANGVNRNGTNDPNGATAGTEGIADR